MLILPSAERGGMTRLGTTWRATKLRLDVGGRCLPKAYTVSEPPAPAFSALFRSTTAETPVGGTPPPPVTCRVVMLAAERAPSSRAGLNAPNAPAAVGAPGRK